MKESAHFIQFDHEKLDSIGFNKSTISELADRFSEYIIEVKSEINSNLIPVIREEEVLNILHKLEGSMQYLAFSGPISYLHVIRTSLEKNTDETLVDSIENLFYIVNETIGMLNTYIQNNYNSND